MTYNVLSHSLNFTHSFSLSLSLSLSYFLCVYACMCVVIDITIPALSCPCLGSVLNADNLLLMYAMGT